jgi:hypothetical protein
LHGGNPQCGAFFFYRFQQQVLSFFAQHAGVDRSSSYRQRIPVEVVQIGTYSLASSVSLMRVLGQEHFPTDVLVEGAAGWLIGHYVFEKHRQQHVKTAIRPTTTGGD